ncbi:MAG: MATE family efflux transporter [Firmicutes bacterium]|nr:MATE family efflux transporter [Bacillota bacterium]
MLKRYIGDRAFYRRAAVIMLPMLIQNVITSFVSLVDNLMVGQIWTEPMSGVAIVNELFFVFNICVFGCIEGADIFTAQFYGKGDLEGVRSSFRFKLIFLVCNLTVFTTLLLTMGDRLIMLFIHEGGEVDPALTFAYARKYLDIAIFQILPFSFVQLYAGTLKCSGQTVVPMIAGGTAVTMNAVLNYILIFGKLGLPAMGVEGAAIATIAAKFTEMAIVVIWSHTHKDKAPFVKGLYSTLKIPGALAALMFGKSLPLFLNEVLWSTGMMAQTQRLSTRGLSVVPALNITNTVWDLFACAIWAMANTLAIMVGHRLGAGELEEAVDEDRKLIALSVTTCAVLGLIMTGLAPYIPLAYNTNDGVRSLATSMLIIAALLLPVNAFVNSCYFTLRSGGKTFFTFIFDSGFIWAVIVPTAFILTRYTALDIVPLYAIVQSLTLIRGVVGYIFVKKRVWVNNLVG